MTPLASPDRLTAALEAPGPIVLDGGFATWAEALGANLDHPLWSARLIQERPDRVLQVHRDFFAAGADCIISATYQATVAGFRHAGASPSEAEDLLTLGVRLAVQARDEAPAVAGALSPDRRLVAASVGPYGAALADGSEYRGDYGVSAAGLRRFHRQRLSRLAAAGADVLALETVPSSIEARVLVELMDELEPGDSATLRGWLSLVVRDADHLADGTPLSDLEPFLAHPRLALIGVNCVPPSRVYGALESLRRVTAKPLIAYPNSGERYRRGGREWVGSADDLVESAAGWRELGGKIIGGCCRTTPDDIRRLADALRGG